MKALQVVATAILFTMMAVSSQAATITVQPDSADVTQSSDTTVLFERFEASLIYGLSSDITGVKESTLYNALQFKVEYPEFDSKRVEEELTRIVREEENHTVRYKAFLVLNYYQNAEQFGSPDVLLSLLDYSYQDGIFFYLQEKVQSEQLTSN
jgi:hypothetical protein